MPLLSFPGPNDYSFNNSVILSISQPLPVLGVDIVLLEDGIAMEPRETFQLQLIPQDALLANEFLADTLDITIRDSDSEHTVWHNEQFVPFTISGPMIRICT